MGMLNGRLVNTPNLDKKQPDFLSTIKFSSKLLEQKNSGLQIH